MKKAVLFFSLVGTALFGALPPLAQSVREMQELLVDNELQVLLGSGEVIQAVVRTEEGYVLMTRNLLLRVDVEMLSSTRIGPREFRFHFYPPIELIPFIKNKVMD